MTDTILTESPPPHAPEHTWRAALVRGQLVYLFSRLCVVLGAAIVAAELRADENAMLSNAPHAPFADPQYIGKAIPKNALGPIIDVLTSWDGHWYLNIVRDGYPTSVRPHVTYFVSDARAAFFPAFPYLVRAVNAVLPGGDTLAALLTNFLLGAALVLVVGLIARELYGVRISERTMVLVAMFPGSFVLSFAYTEALLLVVAAGCLYCLHKRWWWAAGVLALIGTATRPNGIALVAACVVASIIAIRERRDWMSLVAPVLSPMGFLGFQWWIGHRTGESGVWFRVQRQAWGEGTSYGFTALRRTWDAFSHPLTSPTNTITAVSFLTLLLLCWFLWKYRLPAPMIAYSAVIAVLMLLPETVTARPRFVYTAFPLLICAAVWIDRHRHEWWPYFVAACAAGLVGLTALYGVLGAIP